MTATRKELAEKARLANAQIQLHQQANPPLDRSVASQGSSTYMERKKVEEVRASDQAIAKVIVSELAQKNQPFNAANAEVSVSVKPIVLPMPISAKQDAEYKIALDDILPQEILGLIADYRPYADVEEKKEEKQIEASVNKTTPYQAPANASFFTKNLAHILNQTANDILDGSQAKVDRVIKLVKEKPFILNYPTEGSDRLGRRVKGTLLQIAVMSGDVNIRELKEEEKQHRGIVELLQEAGKLSKDDVAKQLQPVLFSTDAIEANAARNERIFAAVKQFGESILQAGIAEEPAQLSAEVLQPAQVKYQSAIDAFRATLQATLNDVITSGYVFDTSILHQAMTWFEQENNLDRFGGWWTLASDVFWVNGIGSLQCVASSRDAQVCRKGIGDVVDNYQMPERGLKNADRSSLFSLTSSRLGLDFFLGYYGAHGSAECVLRSLGRRARPSWKSYVEQKQQRCKIYAAAGQEICEPVCNSVMRR